MTPKERAIVAEACSWMKHAAIFIRTREKMHQDGQQLYAEATVALDELLKRPPILQGGEGYYPSMGHIECCLLETQTGNVSLLFRGFQDEKECRTFADALVNEGLFRPPAKDVQ